MRIESIAQAMTKICNDPEIRQELIGAGIHRNQDFSREKSAAKIFEVYKKFCNNKAILTSHKTS